MSCVLAPAGDHPSTDDEIYEDPRPPDPPSRPAEAADRIVLNNLTIQTTIGNIGIPTLIDSGASHCFISADLVDRLGLEATSYAEGVQLAAGKAVTSCGIVKNLAFRVNDRDDQEDFIVIPEKRGRLILGMTWLRRTNPLIDWRKGSIDHPAAQPMDTRQSSINLNEIVISRKQAKRLVGKKKAQMFFGFVRVGGKLAESDRESSLEGLLTKYQDVFPEELPGPPPPRDIRHQIATEDEQPVARPMYRLSPRELAEAERFVTEMLQKKMIRPSQSSYSAPLLFVKKSDGSLRLVLDYRLLNCKTIKSRYPLPRMDDLIDRLFRARYFSKLDLRTGFYQVGMDRNSIHKTAFATPMGHFEFLVMPMGLCNAPSTFQSLVNSIFGPAFRQFCLVYLDDVLIFSNTREEHLEHVERVLATLREHRLYAKREKCEWMREEIVFLGYRVGRGNRYIDPAKVAAIQQVDAPRTVTDVRSFLGLVNFCRLHIRDLAEFTAPLHRLTKKDVEFQWTDTEDTAFKEIKKRIAENVALRIPDLEKPFVVRTDASLSGLGAVLCQADEEGCLVPVAFESRVLTPAEKNYPVHELELLAIVHALRIWRHYLEGVPFTVETDHKGLQSIAKEGYKSRRMARWIEFLQDYDFVIRYVPGSSNVAADALSRLSMAKTLENMVVDNHFLARDWPLLAAVPEKNWPKDLPQALRDAFDGVKDRLRAENDTVYFRTTSGDWVPYVALWQRADLVQRVHTGSAHLSGSGVAEVLGARVWWPNMAQDIAEWTRRCPECQQTARRPSGPQEPLHPLEPETIPFRRWSLDFIGRLPETAEGNRWILVAIDHLTRWPIVRALKDATAEEVARFIYEEIVVRFGCPHEILTDRGSNFLAETLESYLRLLGVKHLRTSAYHPRTNGLCERFNGEFGLALTRACKGATHHWDRYLEQTLFGMRVRQHSTTGHSPFYLVYGVQPTLPGDDTTPFVLKESDPRDAAEIRAQLFESLGADRNAAVERTRAQGIRAKEYYDKNVRVDPLRVGDWVLMENLARKKFELKWIGPYQVTRVTPLGTYQLRSPAGQTKEDLVHRMRLRRCRVDPANPPRSFWNPGQVREGGENVESGASPADDDDGNNDDDIRRRAPDRGAHPAPDL